MSLGSIQYFTKIQTVSEESKPIRRFMLGCSHYLILMRIDNPQARSFYELEAYKQQRSVLYSYYYKQED